MLLLVYTEARVDRLKVGQFKYTQERYLTNADLDARMASTILDI